MSVHDTPENTGRREWRTSQNTKNVQYGTQFWSKEKFRLILGSYVYLVLNKVKEWMRTIPPKQDRKESVKIKCSYEYFNYLWCGGKLVGVTPTV